ncbi:hypothetical protein J3Q64DRAFT_1715654 [Phycomyces blakesleeanus]|uniref:Secreted protein n=1 Tax=Phycomyces blakesleeanus TaxID=4837 RepID=A0ABR3BHP2_PHYBL
MHLAFIFIFFILVNISVVMVTKILSVNKHGVWFFALSSQGVKRGERRKENKQCGKERDITIYPTYPTRAFTRSFCRLLFYYYFEYSLSVFWDQLACFYKETLSELCD